MSLMGRQNKNIEALYKKLQSSDTVNPAWFLARCIRCGDETTETARICHTCEEEIRAEDAQERDVNWWDVYADGVRKGIEKQATKTIPKKPPPPLPH